MRSKRCRQCDGPLPSARYFKCFVCQPELPQDNEYLEVGCYDLDAEEQQRSKVIRVHFGKDKECSKCLLTKPIDQFWGSLAKGGRKRSECISCTKQMQRSKAA